MDMILNSKINKVKSQLADKTSFHASKFIAKLQNNQSAKVIFIGDSTTEINETTNYLPNVVGKIDTWLKSIYNPANVNVINMGISGENIHMMWRRIYADIVARNPDLVVICSGINDCNGTNKTTLNEYIEAYNGFILELISSCDCDVIIRTPSYMMNVDYNALQPPYNNVVLGISKKYNLGYFDMFETMKADILSGVIADQNTLMFDHVHPNQNGHEYMFQKLKPFFIPTTNVQRPLNNFITLCADGGFRLKNSGGEIITGTQYMNNKVLSFAWVDTRIQFEYIGSELSIVYATAPSIGTFKVVVDNIEIGTVDCYSTVLELRKITTFSIAKGHHIVDIVCIAKNPLSSSTNLQIQGVVFKKEKAINNEVIAESIIVVNQYIIETYDVSKLPDSFSVGQSNSIVNFGAVGLPTGFNQGILVTHKLSSDTSFRGFITQMYYPRYNSADITTLTNNYYRRGNTDTNTWSAWYKISGVVG